MIVSNDSLVDTDTGEILEYDISRMGNEKLGRLMWRKYRRLYESQRIRMPEPDEYEYRDNDNSIFFQDDCRTWKKNKAIVKAQLNEETSKIKTARATTIEIPSDLSKRASRWWETFINGGFMRKGILRHRNGKPITKGYMAEKMGCGVRNVEKIIHEPSEKGYMGKEKEFYKMDTGKVRQTQKTKKHRTTKPRTLNESQRSIFDRLF